MRGKRPPVEGTPWRLPVLIPLLACVALAIRDSNAWAGTGLVQVQERTASAPLRAYAEVEPVTTLGVPAPLDGRLEGWQVKPGMTVRRGQRLGRLEGPEHAKEVAEARAHLARAESAADLARRNELVVRQTYPAISNLQKLQTARAAVTEADATLGAARARWAAVAAGGVVRAPAAGEVIQVLVGDHQEVAAGALLCRLQDPRQLWLRAVFFGEDAARLRPGLRGTFRPLGGGAPVPVRIRSVFPALRPDGGREAGCEAVGRAGWGSGEAGTLDLEGPSLSAPAVPESALVLDGARWYVLVQEGRELRHREVTPGGQADGWRFILEGLKPGETVQAVDAYLAFHRDVARSFAPPD